MYTYTEIFKPPQSTTSFENQIATFTCETDGGDITQWKLNGTYPNYEETDDLSTTQRPVKESGSDHEHELFILTIKARAVYNGTAVQCVTGDFGSVPVESEIVTLTIQGIYVL